ncbi:MAG: UDP-N-acetylmuramoyl-tripeptide--D-alanyl-D-alanine ligase [Bacteroidota bacterium]
MEELYQIFLKHSVICTDTRTVQPGSLFFCLKGESFNGNKFASQALEKGSAYAIVDEEDYAINEKIILVDDVLKTLQDLAAFHRNNINIPVIGITGSNGKTTTKELILAVLSKKYKVFATHGNLNNHIGVPLSVLQITPDTEIAVIEMGANHIGEIEELCKISQPNYGLITNIGKAHLEGFGSFDNVIIAKTELYKYIEKNEGLVFINNFNPILKAHVSKIQQYSYGTNSSSNIHVTFIVANPYVKLYWENKKTIIESKLIGKYNFENILSAMAIGEYFEVDVALIKDAIEDYIAMNSRSQFVEIDTNTIILDAYNANPTSMLCALENFNLMHSVNKIVMLGDMLELGDYKEPEHEKIVEFLADSNYQKVFLVGSIFSKINKNTDFLTFKTSNDLKEYLLLNPQKDALILIKGSRGIKMEQVLDAF